MPSRNRPFHPGEQMQHFRWPSASTCTVVSAQFHSLKELQSPPPTSALWKCKVLWGKQPCRKTKSHTHWITSPPFYKKNQILFLKVQFAGAKWSHFIFQVLTSSIFVNEEILGLNFIRVVWSMLKKKTVKRRRTHWVVCSQSLCKNVKMQPLPWGGSATPASAD